MTITKPPKVAFMPCFNDFGETYPLIEIAKKYMELGGQVVFIGYIGEYEKFAVDLGCKVIELQQNIPKKISEKNLKLLHKYHYKNIPQERFYTYLFNKESEKLSKDRIEQEINIFIKEKVRLVVSAFNFSPLISARVVNIPLVTLLSGVAIPPYFKSKCGTFPESFENPITRLFPQSIKNHLTNWYILRCRWGVKGFNRLARIYETPRLNRFLDLFYGDYTFIVDDINFLKLQPTTKFPKENFIGPILPEYSFSPKDHLIDSEVEKHLKRPGRSILVAIGSYGVKKTFLEVLNALNKTNYNVLVSYKTIIKEDELPTLNKNFLVKKFFPSIKRIHEMVDLTIIHGGRGTVYTAAFSGKPVIGIPMHAEQQWNLDNLMRYDVGIMLSKKYFTERKLLTAINKIFTNYETYLKNATLLKNKLQKPKAAEIAAQKILEIANS